MRFTFFLFLPSVLAQWRRPTTPDLPGHFVPFSKLSTCPALARRSHPTSASDVRPDDFKAVIALGDSITAAFLAKSSRDDFSPLHSSVSHPLSDIDPAEPEQHPFKLDSNRQSDELEAQSIHILPFNLQEDRGVSYAAGGDPSAITIPNIISHYAGQVNGSSKGSHAVVSCLFGFCLHPEGDGLNGAVSGSVSAGLLSQVRDYVVPTIKEMGVPEEDWKYVNLGIGANDICAFCLSPNITTSLPVAGSPEEFAQGIKVALDHLRDHVPNIIVNIIGVFKVSEIYALTLKDPYCSTIPLIPHLPLECSCALIPGPAGDWTRKKMDELGEAYDKAVRDVIVSWRNEEVGAVNTGWRGKKDQGEEGGRGKGGFGVTWQPGTVVDLAHYPINALSPVDCFHPSILAHERMAAGIWNRLSLPLAERTIPIKWEDEVRVRCLEEDDRIKLWLN